MWCFFHGKTLTLPLRLYKLYNCCLNSVRQELSYDCPHNCPRWNLEPGTAIRGPDRVLPCFSGDHPKHLYMWWTSCSRGLILLKQVDFGICWSGYEWITVFDQLTYLSLFMLGVKTLRCNVFVGGWGIIMLPHPSGIMLTAIARPFTKSTKVFFKDGSPKRRKLKLPSVMWMLLVARGIKERNNCGVRRPSTLKI